MTEMCASEAGRCIVFGAGNFVGCYSSASLLFDGMIRKINLSTKPGGSYTRRNQTEK